MNDRDGRVSTFRLLHQQECNRFSNNHAAPENDDMSAGDVDLRFNKQALNAERRTGNEAARITHRELGHVDRMKSIDVFRGIERAHDLRLIDLFRWRGLNENSVDRRVAIQLLDTPE